MRPAFSGMRPQHDAFTRCTCFCFEAEGPGSFFRSICLCVAFLKLARTVMATRPQSGFLLRSDPFLLDAGIVARKDSPENIHVLKDLGR